MKILMKNFRKNKRDGSPAFIPVLLILALCAVLIAVSMGQVNIPLDQTVMIILKKLFNVELPGFKDIPTSYFNIVWMIRFPRTLTSLMVGMGLSLCGIVMQASVENPLADPYILGISSGATLGATFALMIGVGSIPVIGNVGVAGCAFTGALAASFLVLFFANIGGKTTGAKLVLAGTVINSMFSAFSNMIIYFADNSQALQSVTFWIMGSTASATWNKVPMVASVTLITVIFFLAQSSNLNLMLMGEEAATTLGVNLTFWRRIYLIIASLITGILVANCGMIGFVGLVIPHITRAIFGANHRILTPYTVLIGGIFMTVTDLLSRMLVTGSELPVGIITASIGAPVFLYMLLKKDYGFGGA
ncbi:MAG: iron ABC transporter permease [Acetatifactor sp.]|nr:iron ABC transporter permease [Acetatifactor sp.]